MKTVVLIDNYDSFTHNLKHYLQQCGVNCIVFKNDEILIEDLLLINHDGIVISPGPETPEKAGITLDVISNFKDKKPILGICLGHQAIGLHFGANIIESEIPVHGKTTKIKHLKNIRCFFMYKHNQKKH